MCPDFTGVAVGLESCFTAFLALAFGLIVGLICFVIECCSRLSRLNFYFLEAYDRSDDLIEGLDVEDIPRIVDFKDAIIRDMEEEVISLKLKLEEVDRAKGRNGSRVKRRVQGRIL